MSCIDISKEQREYQKATGFLRMVCSGQLCREDTLFLKTKELYPTITEADISDIMYNNKEFLLLTPRRKIIEGETVYYLVNSGWRRLFGIIPKIDKRYLAQVVEYHTYVTYLPIDNSSIALSSKIEKHVPKEIKSITLAYAHDIFTFSSRHEYNNLCYVLHGDVMSIIDCSYGDYACEFLGKRCDENGVMV